MTGNHAHVSLQRKILWILLALGLSYAGIDYAIQRFLVLPEFARLERDLAERNVQRVVEALTYEIRALDRLCASRADDPGIQACLAGGGTLSERDVAGYVRDRELNLHFVVDDEGGVRQGLVLDAADGKPTELTGFPQSRWAATHALLRHAPRRPRTAGVILSARGPLLVAARAARPEGPDGPAAGTVVLGRFMDYAHAGKLRGRLYADISIQPLDTPLSGREEVALKALRSTGDSFYIESGHENLTAYTLFDSLDGEPALLLAATNPRSILAQGQRALWLDTLTGLATGLVALLILITVLRQIVSAPLRRLTQHVTSIDRSTGLAFYDAAPVADEIGTLGREFNRMIRRLKQDIGEREKAEAALLEMRERVLRAEHLATLGEMGASVAHEIRNPLAGIRGAVQVLLGPLPQDDPKRPVLEEMLALVDRGEGTVRRLLDYAKPWEPAPQMADLAERIRLARQDIEDKGLPPNVSIRYTGPDELNTPHDPVLTRQVFYNLMDNAIQAMPDGGFLEWRIAPGDDTVTVTLDDEGGGIPPGEEENLFKPFYTTRAHGTGLGLPICRRIIEAQGGTIHLAARPEGGARATITLPKGS